MNHPCRCGRTWTSLTDAHCGSCHEHFANITGFDAHRLPCGCANPATVDLIKRDGVWATLEGHRQRAELFERARVMRDSRRPSKNLRALDSPDVDKDRDMQVGA